MAWVSAQHPIRRGEQTSKLTFLAADNVLEFDILTTAGEFLTVNSKTEPELFWALKGGGPSTYAIILSATLRTYEALPAAGAVMTFTGITDPDVFWEGVRIFHAQSNHFVDSGLYVYFELVSMFLSVKPFLAVNQTVDELRAILAPMEEQLTAAGIGYDLAYSEHETAFDAYLELFDDEPAGAFSLTGGWLFSHKDVEKNNDAIIEAFKTVASPREDLADQGVMIGHLWNAGYGRPESNSATHPVFREATDFIITVLNLPVGSSIEKKADLQNVLTNTMDEALRKAGKHGCSYVNEVSFFILLFLRKTLHKLGRLQRLIGVTGRSVSEELAEGLLG